MQSKKQSLAMPELSEGTKDEELTFLEITYQSEYSSDLESLDSVILNKMIPSKRQAAEEEYQRKKEQKEKLRQQKIIDQQQKTTQILKLDYTPHKIMLILSKEMLGDIRELWTVFEQGITILQFCQLMVDRIKTINDDQKYELIYGCYKLFNEVDINGDGKMEWDEFMQYIIDKVSQAGLEQGDRGESVKQQIEKMKSR